jgi:hypothetical protein
VTLPTIPAVVYADDVTDNTLNMSSVVAELRNLQQTVKQLLDRQSTMTPTPVDNSSTPAEAPGYTLSTVNVTPLGHGLTPRSQNGLGSGIASHSLPYAETVSPTLRKNILAGSSSSYPPLFSGQ